MSRFWGYIDIYVYIFLVASLEFGDWVSKRQLPIKFINVFGKEECDNCKSSIDPISVQHMLIRFCSCVCLVHFIFRFYTCWEYVKTQRECSIFGNQPTQHS